jgi:hypothetical protein
MRHTIPKRERLFPRMEQLSQEGMVAGQKLRPIFQGNMNHSVAHSRQDLSGLSPEPLTLSRSLSLNQAYPMFALRLFSSQVRQLIQRIEIGPR